MLTSTIEETESNVDEDELDNFLESSLIVKTEGNKKIKTLKTRIKMKTEP